MAESMLLPMHCVVRSVAEASRLADVEVLEKGRQSRCHKSLGQLRHRGKSTMQCGGPCPLCVHSSRCKPEVCTLKDRMCYGFLFSATPHPIVLPSLFTGAGAMSPFRPLVSAQDIHIHSPVPRRLRSTSGPTTLFNLENNSHGLDPAPRTAHAPAPSATKMSLVLAWELVKKAGPPVLLPIDSDTPSGLLSDVERALYPFCLEQRKYVRWWKEQSTPRQAWRGRSHTPEVPLRRKVLEQEMWQEADAQWEEEDWELEQWKWERIENEAGEEDSEVIGDEEAEAEGEAGQNTGVEDGGKIVTQREEDAERIHQSTYEVHQRKTRSKHRSVDTSHLGVGKQGTARRENGKQSTKSKVDMGRALVVALLEER